jgi:hypothetical protein
MSIDYICDSTKMPCELLAVHQRVPSAETGTVKISISTRNQLEQYKKQPGTYSTQAKLANNTTSPSSCRAPVFDCRRPGVAAKSIQLELRLVAHLGGERLVTCDVEVCAARNLVVCDTLARLDVA